MIIQTGLAGSQSHLPVHEYLTIPNEMTFMKVTAFSYTQAGFFLRRDGKIIDYAAAYDASEDWNTTANNVGTWFDSLGGLISASEFELRFGLVDGTGNVASIQCWSYSPPNPPLRPHPGFGVTWIPGLNVTECYVSSLHEPPAAYTEDIWVEIRTANDGIVRSNSIFRMRD